MLHMNGLKGGINNEIGGEIDVLPTLLHLLGVNTKNYIQFGSDLLSSNHRQIVIFRNGTIVTPKYVIVNGKGIKGTIYNNQTGEKISHFTSKQKQEIKTLTKFGYQSLHNSDLLNNRTRHKELQVAEKGRGNRRSGLCGAIEQQSKHSVRDDERKRLFKGRVC